MRLRTPAALGRLRLAFVTQRYDDVLLPFVARSGSNYQQEIARLGKQNADW